MITLPVYFNPAANSQEDADDYLTGVVRSYIGLSVDNCMLLDMDRSIRSAVHRLHQINMLENSRHWRISFGPVGSYRKLLWTINKKDGTVTRLGEIG